MKSTQFFSVNISCSPKVLLWPGRRFARDGSSCNRATLRGWIKTIRGLGWNSNALTRMYWKSGFAICAQNAIRRAAQLALRKVNKRFNTAEIGHVAVAKHLWFYVARVGIFSRYIQESPFLGSCDELSTPPVPTTFDARHHHM